MTDSIEKLTETLKSRIDNFEPNLQVSSYGTVLMAGDGVATVEGLPQIRLQEQVLFENGVQGIAFNLNQDTTGIIILGDHTKITQGTKVFSQGRITSIPVGKEMLGRVINPLGEAIDGKGPIPCDDLMPIERDASGILDRQDVDTPLQTGIKAIDAMIPIGRGQRELIIGDKQTGKTAIAIDTIINQKGKGVYCIYVAIGQKKSSVARTIERLEQYGCMDYTCIVLAGADDSASMQYIAPYAGCTLGEFFMYNGEDALIIYDDLSKHAWAYRELSLLMRRPPGREAYPGDIFYLHARLLERSARLSDRYLIVPDDFKGDMVDPQDFPEAHIFRGPRSLHDVESAINEMEEPVKFKVGKVLKSGGSMTALPIIETQMGDVSAYISTNIISITDGQIYLEEDLFNSGIRPAINVGISVSRVGGDAQTKAMKQVAATLRLDMATFKELAAYAQFGAELDETTRDQLNRGLRLQEILKQPQYQPLTLAEQVVILFAAENGYTDLIPKENLQSWESELLIFIESSYAQITQEINQKKVLSEEIIKMLKDALETFNITWIV
ncbi:MAG: F0F1 ATP synthase subunit alpha [Anaerolineaceae bacterium]|nr:F0F1 ATP synthase subunit alpha [Anaerolineaceae bacterium]